MDISVRDLKMMYQSSVVLWKGVPVYIEEIGEDYKLRCFDIGSQKYKNLSWIPENFTPPSVRIGYVNIGTNCFYLHRVPVRKYKVGLCSENIKSIKVDHTLSHEENYIASRTLRRLNTTNLYDAIMGNYPNLQDAYIEAKDNDGVVAFDKQFAVSADKTIYYKGKKVGSYNGVDVDFDEKYRHLVKAFISR